MLVLTWGLGMPIPSDQLVTYLPWDVIMIIASVICAIACMQLAGGMDYLAHLAEKALRKNPSTSPSAAPVVTFHLMTMLAGTGHTAFSTLPGDRRSGHESRAFRPSRPLLHRGRCLLTLPSPPPPSRRPWSLSPACWSRLASTT